ncbi:hypothetical protein Tco_0682163 [Tanacetum coccineum]|uniref:Reverse transcriptase domain-containing protein n=1 Tax=Tanacetum coccineum TaxID=301880 RepID=A0ABQ4XQD7_9ASTR
MLRKGLDFFEESIKKSWGKELANERVRSSSHVLIVPSFSSSSHVFASLEFVNVFVRIGFNSTIELVSFDESQVVTFNGKFVYGFRNGDCRTGSRSNNTVDSLHGFVIHVIEVLKGNEKVTEVIDVENWRIDNSRVRSGSGSGSTSSELEARVCIQRTICIVNKLHFIEDPVRIIHHEVKQLKQSRIPIVKVHWKPRRGPEFTWEREDQVKSKCTHLFTSKPRVDKAN